MKSDLPRPLLRHSRIKTPAANLKASLLWWSLNIFGANCHGKSQPMRASNLPLKLEDAKPFFGLLLDIAPALEFPSGVWQQQDSSGRCCLLWITPALSWQIQAIF